MTNFLVVTDFADNDDRRDGDKLPAAGGYHKRIVWTGHRCHLLYIV